jgi:hypothetical protein
MGLCAAGPGSPTAEPTRLIQGSESPSTRNSSARSRLSSSFMRVTQDPCRGQRTADLSRPVVAYGPATPAHRPPGAGAGVRSKRRRPEPAWRELKPQRRALSQAQAQSRRVGPAPSRRRPGNASAAERPTPPRQLSRRGRSILPHPSRRRRPARATAAPYRQARHDMARLRHQRCDATRARVRPIQARNNSEEYSLSPEGAKPLLSRADLLLSCYQEALPSTPKYPSLYSNFFHELCGAKRARTADLLHAMGMLTFNTGKC